MQHHTFDMNDPATELARAKIMWRSRAMLKKRHELAMRAVEALSSFSAMLVSVGTKLQCTPDQQQILHDLLFQVFAESVYFPDSALGKFSSHEEFFELILKGLRVEARRINTGKLKLCKTNPWSVRMYVRTAWNFEFGRVSSCARIGHYSLESAHRTVFHFLNRYCAEYYWVRLQRTANGQHDDALRIAFAAKWCTDAIHAELQEIPEALRTEYAALIERFNRASDEECGIAPRSVLIEDADSDALLTPRQIADRFNIPFGPLQSRLKRWRVKNPDGWVERANRSRREAAYMFKLGRVRPIIDELVAATSQRPAQ